MDRQRHCRENPVSGLTTKLMVVFLIVAGMWLLLNTLGSSDSLSSASLVPDLPGLFVVT